MKNLLYIILLVLFVSSCAVHQPRITYENTNASLVQQSIKNLKTVEKLKSKITKNDKIVVVGMEDEKTGDYSLLATLEDIIIKQFVTDGYKVLERDDDMIYRLISESLKNYQHVDKATLNSSKSISNVSDVPELSSADKIISYRVIESGIIYDYAEKNAKIGEVEREARTILEVRLMDAKTSEILSAITLDGKANDFVKQEDIEALKKLSYNYYSHTLPKQNGTKNEPTVTGIKKFNAWPWIGGTIGFILLLSIVSSY